MILTLQLSHTVSDRQAGQLRRQARACCRLASVGRTSKGALALEGIAVQLHADADRLDSARLAL